MYWGLGNEGIRIIEVFGLKILVFQLDMKPLKLHFHQTCQVGLSVKIPYP
ncbi:hypothetical protein HanPSC8_Chr06g0243321 [Helianthus annuus]|nr:hypothetical protein HanPSC8_Chr06g0243321 [Helianthus annuus]